MTACNIACERALAPFVTTTKGERSEVASYSEKRQARSGRGESGRGEGEAKRRKQGGGEMTEIKEER